MSFFQSLVITAAWLSQLGEHRSAEREVVGSNPGRTNDQVRWCWLQWFETLSQLKWSRHWVVTFSYWPCLLHPSFISKINGDVKEPTLLLAKSRVRFPSGVVYLSRITCYSYHGLWVGYSKFINGLIAATISALVSWCIKTVHVAISNKHTLNSSYCFKYTTIHHDWTIIYLLLNRSYQLRLLFIQNISPILIGWFTITSYWWPNLE